MQIFQGIRVVELAQYVFVPAAGAVLADFGAEVIKVEPPGGDAYRHLELRGAQASRPNLGMEQNNRGKRSVVLDLKSPEGAEVMRKLVADADVFLTNFRPGALTRLGLDAAGLREMNPNIIYARGTGLGPNGPDSGRPGYDSISFWSRGGIAALLTDPKAPHSVRSRGAFGDHIGAMNLAFGIAGALLHRERTGEAAVVDASLFAAAMWTISSDATAAQYDDYTAWFERTEKGNPLTNSHRTSDGRWIQLCMQDPDRDWRALCQHIGHPDLADDPRFKDAKARKANRDAITDQLDAIFGRRSYAEWLEALADFPGPWEPQKDMRELLADPQVEANGYFPKMELDGGGTVHVVAAPVSFDGSSGRPTRSPHLGEHTAEVLRGVGLDDGRIEALRRQGVVG